MKNIKIFSDFACPFCYIGFSIIDKLRVENKELNIEWIPFELSPDASMEANDLADTVPKNQIEMAYKRIGRLGSEYGLVYNNKTKKFNTHRLHKAALYANTVDKYYEFSKEAFKAIFEHGNNVGDPAILNEVASSVGLDVNEMNKQIDGGVFDAHMERAKNLIPVYEIDSVPTFMVDDKKKVTTLKEYKKIIVDILGD